MAPIFKQLGVSTEYSLEKHKALAGQEWRANQMHEITDNMIAYVGAKPWHGLGVNVPAGSTGEEMRKLAGLDWRVEMRDLSMQGNDGSMNINSLKVFKAVTRSDNERVFQVATDRYHPVQNEQIIDFFREYCEAGHADLETVGGLRGGAVVWALAKLKGASVKLGGVDELKGYMLLATSHDSTMQTVGRPTQVRVVCHNTLTQALSSGRSQVGIRHTREWTPEVAQEAREVMGLAIEDTQKLNETAEILSKVAIDDAGWEKFMLGLLGEDNVKDSRGNPSRTVTSLSKARLTSPGSDLVTANGTLWGAVNAVTYFSDYERGRTDDSRLATSWFGDGERLKRSAVNVALEMAGVN